MWERGNRRLRQPEVAGGEGRARHLLYTSNDEGRVTGLYLSYNGLSGFIPNSLGNLSQLRTLALSNNQLSGPIPENSSRDSLGYTFLVLYLMVLVDTDVMIDLLRQYSPAVSWLASLREEEIFLPGLVAMELVQGCRNQQEQDWLLSTLDQFQLVWPSTQMCNEALTLFAREERAGSEAVRSLERRALAQMTYMSYNCREVFRMKKTMVYLEDEQYLSLKRAATSSQKRMSEIIREAVSTYLGTSKEEVDYLSFVGIAKGPAKGKASEDAEEILKELFK